MAFPTDIELLPAHQLPPKNTRDRRTSVSKHDLAVASIAERSYDADSPSFFTTLEMSREADAYRDPLEYREDSPLLGSGDDDGDVPGRFSPTPARLRVPATPLPRAQLAAIYLIKLVVPVTNTQILPYQNKMVAGFDLPNERTVGYYTSILSLAHSLGHFATILGWGRLSDRIGRTLVIGFGMLGLALSNLPFGASRTFGMAMVSRMFAGAFSGFVGVIHSVVGELSDQSNQSTVFPYYDIISALGFVIGPLIGGTFEEPATGFGGWFNNAFFRAYPYILPCIITTILGILAAILSVTYLRETHPHKAAKSMPVGPPFRVEPEPGEVGDPLIPTEKPPGLRALMALPVIRALCGAQWMLGFVASSFNYVFVLMAYTPLEDGGLGMNPQKIASALSIMGLVSIGLKASLPIFLRRFDALAVFRATLLTWPLTFALMPLLNVIARRAAAEHSASAEAFLWVAISFVLFMSRLGCMAFSIVMILTKDHTPSSLALASTNSLSELFQGLGGAVGSPFISSMFAFSISNHILGGHLWVVAICLLSLLGDYSASRMAKHRYI